MISAKISEIRIFFLDILKNNFDLHSSTRKLIVTKILQFDIFIDFYLSKGYLNQHVKLPNVPQ